MTKLTVKKETLSLNWEKFSKKAAKAVIYRTQTSEALLRTIKEASSYPLRLLPPEEGRAAVLSALFVCTSLYLGVKAEDQDELLYIKGAEFIIKNFGGLGLAELDEAFNLAAAKKINVNLTPYYGTFRLEAIGELLTAYTAKRNKILQEVNKEIRAAEEAERKAEEAASKNTAARAAFCGEVKKWVDMAKEGVLIFDTWEEVPSNKVRVAYEDKAFFSPYSSIESKRALYKEALDLAVRKARRKIREEIERGQAGTVKLEALNNRILTPGTGLPDEIKATAAVISFQLLFFRTLQFHINDNK